MVKNFKIAKFIHLKQIKIYYQKLNYTKKNIKKANIRINIVAVGNKRKI